MYTWSLYVGDQNRDFRRIVNGPGTQSPACQIGRRPRSVLQAGLYSNEGRYTGALEEEKRKIQVNGQLSFVSEVLTFFISVSKQCKYLR